MATVGRSSKLCDNKSTAKVLISVMNNKPMAPHGAMLNKPLNYSEKSTVQFLAGLKIFLGLRLNFWF